MVLFFAPAPATSDSIGEPIEAERVAAAQVQGTLVPVGESSLPRLQVTVSAPEDTASTITTDGSFSLAVSSGADSLKVRVDAPQSDERSFHPALFLASTSELETGITVFMIPLQWTVQKGMHAGETVDVSMYKALSAPRRAEDYYFGGHYLDRSPDLYLPQIYSWFPEDRPIPVPIRNEMPDQYEITEQDSTELWKVFGKIEDIFGRDLFEPATPEEVGWENGVPQGVIGLKVDDGACGRGNVVGYKDIIWEGKRSSSDYWQNSTSIEYSSDGRSIESGVVETCYDLLDRLAEDNSSAGGTIQHETLQAMGMGHGCLFPSIMSYACSDGVQGLRANVINARDVAYWELRNEMFQKVREHRPSGSSDSHRARFAFLPSLFGERKRMRGLDPIPNLDEWENSVFLRMRHWEADDPFVFEEAGTEIAFPEVGGQAMLRVSRFNRGTRRPDGIEETNLSPDRLVITADEYPWSSDFSIQSGTEVRVEVSTLEGVSDPSFVQAYRRSWTDRASFEKVVTSVSSDSSQVVLKVADFGEFVFYSPRTVRTNATRSFDDASGPSDYRLVALPGKVNRPLSEVVDGKPGSEWQAFWDDGSDENFLVQHDESGPFTLQPGNGFWLTSTEDWTFEKTIPGVQLRGDTATTIPLRPGWNIISNPTSQDVAWSEVQAQMSGDLQAIWGFDGSFTMPDTFRSAAAGKAYYFFNDDAERDSLVVPYLDDGGGKAAPSPTEKGGPMLTLTAAPAGVEGAVGSTVRVGIDERANRGIGAEDLVAPPGPFESTSLRVKAPGEVESKRRRYLMAERRPPVEQGGGQTFALRLTHRADGPVRLSAENLDALGKRSALLLHPSEGETQDLREGTAVQVDPEEKITALKLAIGTEDYLEQKASAVLPEELSLTSYPNPIHQQGAIHYALPEAKEITLRVYDVLGRKVLTLAKGRKEAGRHTVRLGADQLSSGVYVGRLQAGEQTRTLKITVVK